MLALVELLTDAGPVGVQARQEARKLGIDVAKKAGDIQRIALKFFRGTGLDPNDLVQDVLCAILRKNGTPSAFDPSKASFSKYVYLVSRNVVCNALAKQKRHGRIALLPEVPEDVMDAHDPIAAFEHVEASMRVSRTRPLDRTRLRDGEAVLN